MQNYSNLAVADVALSGTVAVYRLTAAFPKEERFGLTSQMRRAAVSVGSNIAEGCGRGGNRELIRFLYISSGSAAELRFQLEVADALGFGDANARAECVALVVRQQKMLSSLITTLRRRER